MVINREGEHMKQRTAELMDKLDEEHDFVEISSSGMPPTLYKATKQCRVCGLTVSFVENRQNDVPRRYTYKLIDGTEISLADAVQRGCH